jgi:exosome complex RNA-binding protein Csl4
VEGVRQGRHLWRVTIAMHGCAERGHVVHPYQQLAVAEEIAEGQDRSDNREELALVFCFFRVPKLSIHARVSSGTSPPHM